MRFYNPVLIINKMIKNKIELKILKLHQIETREEVIKAICELKSLEELYIFELVTQKSYDILEIAMELKNLRIISTFISKNNKRTE